MTVDQAESSARTLTRLRASVLACCGLMTCALVAHVLAWAIAAFTDMRYAMAPADDAAPKVVAAPAAAEEEPPALVQTPNEVPEDDAQHESASLTKIHLLITDAYDLGSAVGCVAVIVLVALVGLGLIIAVTGRTPGVEPALSAFVWSVLLAVFLLPLDGTLDADWQQGVFASSSGMIEAVEASRRDYGGAGFSGMFITRYCAVPIVCIAGCILLLWRFSAGVEAGLVSESQKIDPTLEREAHRVAAAATSLHGGRTVMQRTLERDEAPAAATDEPARRLI